MKPLSKKEKFYALAMSVILLLVLAGAGKKLLPAPPPKSDQSPILTSLSSCGIIRGERGHGSCVVIAPDLLLTAGHCVKRPLLHAEIDEQIYEVVEQWGDDEYDVGFVRVDCNVPLRPVPLNLGSRLAPLDSVYLISSPYRPELCQSITAGIVSHTDRTCPEPGCFLHRHLIQTDAEAAPGSSGGPLLDTDGNIVGICVEGEVPGGGAIFCVPAAHIHEALRRFKTSEGGLDPNAVPE
ncbi:MAG: S1C family serine protease [Planctomycetota bacterium]